MSGPKVYVLLVNWHGWADTVECLESVFRQEYANYQVIVCDNGSQDDSLEHIQAWAQGSVAAPSLPNQHPLSQQAYSSVAKPVECVVYDRAEAEAGGGAGDPGVPLILIQTGANLGFAGANNVGLRYILERGDAEFVWLLNNDTVVGPEALRAMVATAQHYPKIGMVGAKVLYYDRPSTIQAIAGGKVVSWQGMVRHLGEGQLDSGQYDGVVDADLDFVTGASLLVRTALIREIGYLEESYFLYAEEVDWCLQAKQAGWRLGYSPASSVWHRAGSSVVHRSALHDYYSVRNALLLVRKFFPSRLPLAVLYSVYRCLLPKVVRLQPARFRAVLQAYRDFLVRA